jgi:hypothetical protein
MPPDFRLGHLVFEARRLLRWMAFCEHMPWETHDTNVTGTWGRKPKLRLQLRMAAGLIVQKAAGAPRRAKELA